ncbi:aa8abae2-8209-40f0-a2b6-d5b51edec369 [Sclerotinia trifoliorum]|uniref:Aa8abae2-8209-40f0-a2b6-d5b51edec369 n=1 Tax=Sclerotinia trifoliorum TaxID=28548 RepID=A0A8H2W117_9HELO|nr:aa8abae2-8209-40f0-a2b6-d5b51edec369 [Sclerotinia trifoliorum]
MSQTIPTTTKLWRAKGTDGFHCLEYDGQAELPALGDNDVLVKFHGASLNYRDLVMVKGQYPAATRFGVVPGSDGAGEVLAVGSKVARFSPGSKVVTLFSPRHYGGALTPLALGSALGGGSDGTLRQYGVFNEEALVEMPSSLSYLEAGTLSCAAVTAWNALYGLKPLKPGDVVLTQGTGGVSIFALQFAKAAGATVIATTSSDAKAETLKKLGADHVINYRSTPEWGTHAKSLTEKSIGVSHVIEVAGARSMAQSLNAVRFEGVISVIGFLSGAAEEKEPSFLECLTKNCIVRGIVVGSRELFEDMNRAIDANKIKPVVDEKVFKLEELKEAYQYMWDQKHFGKLAIKIE